MLTSKKFDVLLTIVTFICVSIWGYLEGVIVIPHDFWYMFFKLIVGGLIVHVPLVWIYRAIDKNRKDKNNGDDS